MQRKPILNFQFSTISLKNSVISFCIAICGIMLIHSCARMGQPDGGWFDETPPKIVGSYPAERATGVNAKRVQINFDEFIKVENASEKIIVSPPQLEQADIKTTGKGIRIDLKDDLKENTTYTIDFSDAIVDNNEGNPLGNYTYVFSTGEQVDTMEVAGYVLEASNLEPVKGILVGLYNNLEDDAFTKEPMLRVARTDGNGHFVIRGVAEGSYRIYALEDSDGDYKYSQRSEKIAFSNDVIVPSMKDDVRQDTLWADSLHIRGIKRVPYNHFLPDDVVLRAFNLEQADRYFLKAERNDPDHFTLFFTGGSHDLPIIQPLNFEPEHPMVTEHSEKRDTVTYWLRDSILINQDTLRIEMTYLMTDTLGGMISQTDTIEVLPKFSYERRQKLEAEKREKWEKQQEKNRKKGIDAEPYPGTFLEPEYVIPSSMSPANNVRVTFPTPLERIDTASIHLYVKHDTIWYRSPVRIEADEKVPRTYNIKGEWRLGQEYSLEIDSACFCDIYGRVAGSFKRGIMIEDEDKYGSVFVEVPEIKGTTFSVIVQLMDSNDKVVAESRVIDDTAEFYYVRPGFYYLRFIDDANGNGIWDTGDYDNNLQPESVYYHTEKIEVIAKRDNNIVVNPNRTPLYQQKPQAITKQKGEAKKKVKNQNANRAAQLGILPPQ